MTYKEGYTFLSKSLTDARNKFAKKKTKTKKTVPEILTGSKNPSEPIESLKHEADNPPSSERVYESWRQRRN